MKWTGYPAGLELRSLLQPLHFKRLIVVTLFMFYEDLNSCIERIDDVSVCRRRDDNAHSEQVFVGLQFPDKPEVM